MQKSFSAQIILENYPKSIILQKHSTDYGKQSLKRNLIASAFVFENWILKKNSHL